MTDHFDVFEAGEDEVLQQLAADPPRSHHQHLASGKGVSQFFSEGTHQLDHVDQLARDKNRACSTERLGRLAASFSSLQNN